MPKFYRKPSRCEAICWKALGTAPAEEVQIMVGREIGVSDLGDGRIILSGPTGDTIVEINQWIVKDDGRTFIMDDEAFRWAYAPYPDAW